MVLYSGKVSQKRETGAAESFSEKLELKPEKMYNKNWQSPATIEEVSTASGKAKSRKPLGLEQKKGLILLGVFVLLAAALLLVGAFYEGQAEKPVRHMADQAVGKLQRIEYDGQTYIEKTAMTTLLLMGTDQTEASVSYGARQGGQADFLMLLVIDHNDRVIHQLQIDRDTITEVETLGILGNPIGTKPMQICLAHSFGADASQNCGFVKRAVENLLEGITVDDYIALSMNAIPALNSALGGVTVTLEEDLSYEDPQMVKGATLKLNDRQAAILLHDRMQLGDGTNQSRMKRQRLYMTAAADTFRSRIQQETEFLGTFFDALSPFMDASIERGKLLNEINRAYHYEIQPYDTLEGEYSVGEDGFVEFHAAPGAATKWVMETFYKVDINNN